MKTNTDTIKPNNQGELDLGSPIFVGCNYDSNLYDWELEKYESYTKGCWIIEAISKH
jgi:hypothetical protein